MSSKKNDRYERLQGHDLALVKRKEQLVLVGKNSILQKDKQLLSGKNQDFYRNFAYECNKSVNIKLLKH